MPGRTSFTADDDEHIVEFLITHNSDGKGRSGNTLWQNITNLKEAWTKRHSWSSWRSRYMGNQARFDRRIQLRLQENGSQVKTNPRRSSRTKSIHAVEGTAPKATADTNEMARAPSSPQKRPASPRKPKTERFSPDLVPQELLPLDSASPVLQEQVLQWVSNCRRYVVPPSQMAEDPLAAQTEAPLDTEQPTTSIVTNDQLQPDGGHDRREHVEPLLFSQVEDIPDDQWEVYSDESDESGRIQTEDLPNQACATNYIKGLGGDTCSFVTRPPTDDVPELLDGQKTDGESTGNIDSDHEKLSPDEREREEPNEHSESSRRQMEEDDREGTQRISPLPEIRTRRNRPQASPPTRFEEEETQPLDSPPVAAPPALNQGTPPESSPVLRQKKRKRHLIVSDDDASSEDPFVSDDEPSTVVRPSVVVPAPELRSSARKKRKVGEGLTGRDQWPPRRKKNPKFQQSQADAQDAPHGPDQSPAPPRSISGKHAVLSLASKCPATSSQVSIEDLDARQLRHRRHPHVEQVDERTHLSPLSMTATNRVEMDSHQGARNAGPKKETSPARLPRESLLPSRKPPIEHAEQRVTSSHRSHCPVVPLTRTNDFMLRLGLDTWITAMAEDYDMDADHIRRIWEGVARDEGDADHLKVLEIIERLYKEKHGDELHEVILDNGFRFTPTRASSPSSSHRSGKRRHLAVTPSMRGSNGQNKKRAQVSSPLNHATENEEDTLSRERKEGLSDAAAVVNKAELSTVAPQSPSPNPVPQQTWKKSSTANQRRTLPFPARRPQFSTFKRTNPVPRAPSQAELERFVGEDPQLASMFLLKSQGGLAVHTPGNKGIPRVGLPLTEDDVFGSGSGRSTPQKPQKSPSRYLDLSTVTITGRKARGMAQDERKLAEMMDELQPEGVLKALRAQLGNALS